jgi:hypothetical protein
VKVVAGLGSLAALLAMMFGGVQVMDQRYVASDDFKSLSVEIFFQRYYDTEDRIEEKIEKDPNADVDDLDRRLERLRSKICEIESEWERCKEAA